MATVTTKQLTGYNLFVKEQMPTIKTIAKGKKERFELIGAAWRSLSQADHEQWNFRALNSLPVVPSSLTAEPKKKKGPISGYNLFVREQTKGVKTPTGDMKTKMSTIGAAWRKLPFLEQEKYNAQAKAITVN